MQNISTYDFDLTNPFITSNQEKSEHRDSHDPHALTNNSQINFNEATLYDSILNFDCASHSNEILHQNRTEHQQTIDQLSSLHHNLTNGPESNASVCQSYPITSTTVDCSQSSNIDLHEIINKSESISMTFDQFQALINGIPDLSITNNKIMTYFLENSVIIGNKIPIKLISTTNSNYIQIDQYEKPMNVHKSSHRQRAASRIIEKRYRSSINDRINELQQIVASSRDGKVHQSDVLQRSIEYIRQLQSANRQLEAENTTLKCILKRLNVTSITHSTNEAVQSTKYNDTTKTTQNRTNSKKKKPERGMADGSRLMLCFFMLFMIIKNPFYYLLDYIHLINDDNNDIGLYSIINSRRIQSEINYIDFNLSYKQFISCLLNIVICLICLVKIFVHGEPVVYEFEMDQYFLYKKRADQYMNEKQLKQAQVYYKKCCEQLHVSIDGTYFHCTLSIIWQMIRLLINLIYIGRWLTYWSGWTKSIDTRIYHCELNHCLLQLWKIEYQYTLSTLNMFNLCLLTMNTYINSRKKLNVHIQNETFLLLILTFKKFNNFFLIFIQYFLKYIRPSDINDIYFLDKTRLSKFIYEKNINLFRHTIFFESIRIQYLEYIIYDDIRNQISYFNDQEQTMIQHEYDIDYFSCWQYCLQIMRCISNTKQNIKNITIKNLTNQHLYELMRSKRIIDQRYIDTIEIIHEILLALNDDEINSMQHFLLEKLGEKSQLLTSNIEKYCLIDNQSELYMAINTLLFDGILSLRLRLSTNSILHDDKQMPFLNDFQRELKSYKQLNRIMKLPRQKVDLFESISRIASGFNPLWTQVLFECTIKQSIIHIDKNQESIVNLNLISALLIFCYFSPSTIFHYKKILQCAIVKLSETGKANDLHRLRRKCVALIEQSFITL